MSLLESWSQLAQELVTERETLRPLLARASQLGGPPTLDNAARECATEVDRALGELIRQIGNIAQHED